MVVMVGTVTIFQINKAGKRIFECMMDEFCHYMVQRSVKFNKKCRPKNILIIRHGESEGNIDSKVYAGIFFLFDKRKKVLF